MKDDSAKLSELIELTIKNQELLYSILEEQRSEADEGEYIIQSGVATTSQFTIIDTQIAPGHDVKGYAIQNDGLKDLLVAHNVALSSVGPDIIDVSSNITKFSVLTPGETAEYSYNRRKIRNIYLLGSGGNAHYRIKLIW